MVYYNFNDSEQNSNYFKQEYTKLIYIIKK